MKRWTCELAICGTLMLFACSQRNTAQDLVDVIGPQPEEVMQFLSRPQTTILNPLKTEWLWSRVYFKHGEQIENGCRFEEHSKSHGDAGRGPGKEQRLSYSLANDFSACEILTIEGEPKTPLAKTG